MTESGLWLPVAAAADLPLGQLGAVKALDEEFVIWRTASGTLAAATDRCPHRGTRMSIGCVRGEHIACAYHGWLFEVDGRRAGVPALPALELGDRFGLESIAIRESQGMLWLRCAQASPAAALALPPALPPAQDIGLSELICGPYEVRTSYGRVIENFLDLAHFPFVHPGTLGDPAHPEMPDYTVLPGREGAGPVAQECRAWQPRSNLLADQGAMVAYRYQVLSPFVALLSKCPEGWQAYEESIAMMVLPVQPAVTRVWFRILMSAGDRSPQQIRAFQEAIFEEDRRILEAQRPAMLPLSPRDEHSVSIDRLSLAYRAYLRELGLSFGLVSGRD